MPCFEDLTNAALLRPLLRAFAFQDPPIWAQNIKYELSKRGGLSVIHPQLNLNSVSMKKMPNFLIELITPWRHCQRALNPDWATQLGPLSPINCNKLLPFAKWKRGTKDTLLEQLSREEIVYVGQFFDKNGGLLGGMKATNRGLRQSAFLEWTEVYLTLHKLDVKMPSDITIGSRTCLPALPQLKTKDGCLQALDISQSKVLKAIAKTREYVPNGTQIKTVELLNIAEDDWGPAWKNMKNKLDSNLAKAFLFTLLSGVTYTNKAYVRMGRKSSSDCTFCGQPKQSFIHTFVLCQKVKDLREKLSKNWDGMEMSEKRWFLGSGNYNEPTEIAKDFIARQLNLYVFKSNWAEKQLNEIAFANIVKEQEEAEIAYADRVNLKYDAQLKWEHVKELLKHVN